MAEPAAAYLLRSEGEGLILILYNRMRIDARYEFSTMFFFDENDILLQRLPWTLNMASNPASGQSGLQQRGTPTAIGQQSLELQ